MPLLDSLRRLTAGIPHPGVLLERRPLPEDANAEPAWQTCENAACGFKRKHGLPAGRHFEGRWMCSDACWSQMLLQRIEREWVSGDAGGFAAHMHRVPLGLLLLSLGWVTADELQAALESQRKAKTGRIGYWLRKQTALTEKEITRALAMQWNCPVFDLGAYRPQAVEIPRELIETYRILPLPARNRNVLYLAFDSGMDAIVSYAVRHMTGLSVETGLAGEKAFASAWTRALALQRPAAVAASVTTAAELYDAVSSILESWEVSDARLSRLHQHVWLRVFRMQPGSPKSTEGSPAHATDYLYRLPSPVAAPQ
jgi:Type II secretion system (T2SS), protein E, N-terminal domain